MSDVQLADPDFGIPDGVEVFVVVVLQGGRLGTPKFWELEEKPVTEAVLSRESSNISRPITVALLLAYLSYHCPRNPTLGESRHR